MPNSEGSVGQNVKYHVDGTKLILEVDLNDEQDHTVKSGAIRVASTLGTPAIDVNGKVYRVGLNVTRK